MAVRVTGEETNFKTMSRIALGEWYRINVGYNPIEDWPPTKLSELRERCQDYCEIRAYAEANPDW